MMIIGLKNRCAFLQLVIFATLFSIGTVSCSIKTQEQQKETDFQHISEVLISEQEVLEAQKKWGEGIVLIGKVFSDGDDFKAAALKHIDDLYGYHLGPVLFKPTLASYKQFRTDKEGALSYFIGQDPNYPEDHGFAIKPWVNVRWESIGIKTEGNMAVAMGNYYFTPSKGGDAVKVEYTFAYTKDKNGKLRIIMHGSHLPYAPAEKH